MPPNLPDHSKDAIFASAEDGIINQYSLGTPYNLELALDRTLIQTPSKAKEQEVKSFGGFFTM